MKSTGKLAGVWYHSLKKPSIKLFEASYLHLPTFGNVVFYHADDAKEEAFGNYVVSKIIRTLQLAGTAKVLASHGLQTQLVAKSVMMNTISQATSWQRKSGQSSMAVGTKRDSRWGFENKFAVQLLNMEFPLYSFGIHSGCYKVLGKAEALLQRLFDKKIPRKSNLYETLLIFFSQIIKCKIRPTKYIKIV